MPAVRRAADMGRNALAITEDFDRLLGHARPNLLAQQLVGHGVMAPVDLDMVVEPDRALLPLRIDVRGCGQGFERRPLQVIKELPAAGAEMPRDAIVEPIDQRADRRVQFGQREEPPVAQPRHDPALRHLDGDLDLRLVARLVRARRHTAVS